MEEGRRRVDGEGVGARWRAWRRRGRSCRRRVRVGEADAGEGGDFAFVGGDVEQRVGDEAVDDSYSGCEDAGGLMPKRRTPSSMTQSQVELTAQISTPRNWSSRMRTSHLGKDVGFDLGGEEFGGGGAEVGLAEAGVDLDHLAADFEFGDLAGEVAAVADVEARDGFGERMPCSMVQRMKPEPASPDQRVPSQSKTAMTGSRFGPRRGIRPW